MDKGNPLTLKHSIKYKFLRGTILIEDAPETRNILNYAKMKGVCFKKILAWGSSSSSAEKSKRCYYPKGNHTNYLTYLSLPLKDESHYMNLVKHSRNLKDITFSPQDGHSLALITQCIKRLSKNIRTMSIRGGLEDMKVRPEMIKGLYRSLRICRKLRTLEKELKYQYQRWDPQALDCTKIEYETINQYIPRNKNLSDLRCKHPYEDYGLYRLMSEGLACPSVTSLSMPLHSYMLGRDQDHINRIPPVFRFNLFPNLRQLRISVYTEQRQKIVFGSSVTQGLKSLVHLEQFNICLGSRVKGVGYIFKGLRNLCLLSHLSLHIGFIHSHEELLLIEFLTRQSRLVSVHLSLDTRLSSRYNNTIEAICRCLNSMKRLKDLSLYSQAWQLKSLSAGLSQLEMINQLETLDVTTYDNILTTSSTPESRVEGLCGFIKRQKLSLRALKIRIEAVKDDIIVDSIIKTVAEAEGLTKLALNMNTGFINYETIEEFVRGFPTFSETFVHLKQTLQRLTQLTKLDLDIEPLIIRKDEDKIVDSVLVFEALPAMKNLRQLTLALPYMKKSIMTHPGQLSSLLSEAKYLMHVDVRTCFSRIYENRETEVIEELEEVLMQTRQQRYIRSHLTFSDIDLIE